jgi:hypothetical protein
VQYSFHLLSIHVIIDLISFFFLFILFNVLDLEIHVDMKEVIGNSSIPDFDTSFTGILFVDNLGCSLNFE